jgi:hypothetical protein
VCDQPVAQTGQAWLPHDWDPVYGGLCSGSFTKTCSSGGSAQGEYHEPAHYRVTLTAPFEQVWIAAPDKCSGVGTETIDCTFTAGGTPF